MARSTRSNIPNVPQLISQRGNNGQNIFQCDNDRTNYIYWANMHAMEFNVDIHAWALVDNAVYLLVSPSTYDGISKFMQSLGRRYVRHYNKKYNRTGTLWEGRFKACIVEPSGYLMHCHHYIELQPISQGINKNPESYLWSSYGFNALGKKCILCSPHEEYLKLSKDYKERKVIYSDLLQKTKNNTSLLTEIHNSLKSSIALGSDEFKDNIESVYNIKARKGKAGRPAKAPNCMAVHQHQV